MEKEIQDPTKSEERKESVCEKETKGGGHRKYKNGTKGVRGGGKEMERDSQEWGRSGWAARLLP